MPSSVLCSLSKPELRKSSRPRILTILVLHGPQSHDLLNRTPAPQNMLLLHLQIDICLQDVLLLWP